MATLKNSEGRGPWERMDTIPGEITHRTADLASSICEKVRNEINKDLGITPSDEKMFLGSSVKSWAGWLAKGGIVIATFLFAWYTTVNSEMADRPTKKETRALISDEVHGHEDHGHHRAVEELVKSNAEQIKALSDIQIRQTAILENQTQTLMEIKDEIKRR